MFYLVIACADLEGESAYPTPGKSNLLIHIARLPKIRLGPALENKIIFRTTTLLGKNSGPAHVSGIFRNIFEIHNRKRKSYKRCTYPSLSLMY